MRNTTSVLPPRTPEEGYHLSEDLADDAIGWLHPHKALEPDKPFFMYWASGCLHGPHHVMKEWADRYAGKFDDGWDAYRERATAGAKEKGWIPQDAELTPRHPSMAAWEDIPEDERPFQRRLMEVAAGFAEHVDVQVGRLVDEIEALGYGDNTLVFYIWGDNGSSGEGQNGTISELLAQNGIPTTVDMHIKALEELGGLDVLGSPKTDNQYHAGWGWAGSTPYKGMKLLASHFGGTRNPMAVRWPAKIDPGRDAAQPSSTTATTSSRRSTRSSGSPRRGSSTASRRTRSTGSASPTPSTTPTPRDGCAPSTSRSWAAAPSTTTAGWPPRSAPGCRGFPACPPGIQEWTPDQDTWELYNLDEDWSQANDLADQQPDKLAQLKEMFAIEAARNSVYPVGGGLWIPLLHPELRISPPYREWNFTGDITRMPEFCAPALGNKPNIVTIDVDIPDEPDGVLYALGGQQRRPDLLHRRRRTCATSTTSSSCMRTKIRSDTTLPTGPATIEVSTTLRRAATRPAHSTSPCSVNGDSVAHGQVPVSAPLLFTANDCLDIGTCLGSPVSLDYCDRAPFPFNGTIHRMHVTYHRPSRR